MAFIETFRTQVINVSGSGDNVLITPSAGAMPTGWDNPGTYIAIDFISFVPGAGVTVTFNSGKATGEGTQTAMSGPMALATAQTLTWENSMRNEHGVITLNPNQSFIITLNGAVQISGLIRYRLVNTN